MGNKTRKSGNVRSCYRNVFRYSLTIPGRGNSVAIVDTNCGVFMFGKLGSVGLNRVRFSSAIVPQRQLLGCVILALCFVWGAPAQMLTARVFLLDESQRSPITAQAASTPSQPDPGEVDVYDPTRDAEADLRQALSVARRDGKRVLLEVGGKWCIWCKILDHYFVDNPDLLALRKSAYVMVKVNFSPDNENAAVLAKYPKPAGYPHLYVLDDRGKLLVSQDTGELEEGRSYHHGRMREFLSRHVAPSVSR
jgi:thiol:disulfide interchange protein